MRTALLIIVPVYITGFILTASIVRGGAGNRLLTAAIWPAWWIGCLLMGDFV